MKIKKPDHEYPNDVKQMICELYAEDELTQNEIARKVSEEYGIRVFDYDVRRVVFHEGEPVRNRAREAKVRQKLINRVETNTRPGRYAHLR